MLLYSSLTQNSTNIQVILRLIVAGAGMGMSMSSLMNSMVENVPADKIGMTSGINNMTRTLGTVLGVAVFLTIFTSNIAVQMSDAKASAISIIKADKVFDANAKEEMLTSFKSKKSQTKTLSQALTAINVKEAVVLKSVPAVQRGIIKHSFDAQKKETKKIWPVIQNTFTTHTVNTFSFTFKCGALILLPGIFFAFFSSKKKKRNSDCRQETQEAFEPLA